MSADSTPLPPGWTAHELAGRQFYFHAATNTTQHERPGSLEMNAMTAPMYPLPAAAPVPQVPVQQVQPIATPPPPAAAVARPEAPLPQALQMQQVAQVSIPPQALQAAALAIPAAPQASATTYKQLQVLVPEPGLRAGQQLVFTPPAAPGQQPQQMSVTVNQECVAGTVVTVQIPAAVSAVHAPSPHLQYPGAPQLGLPVQTVNIHPDEDKRQSNILWGLYLGGLGIFCCVPPLGMLLLVMACGMYFCKTADQRAQYRQARTPAWTACITLTLCCMAAAALIPLAILAEQHHEHMHPMFGGHGHHNHNHHDDDGAPDQWFGPGKHAPVDFPEPPSMLPPPTWEQVKAAQEQQAPAGMPEEDLEKVEDLFHENVVEATEISKVLHEAKTKDEVVVV